MEDCFRGQMGPPVFPVSWAEIERLTHCLEKQSVADRERIEFPDGLSVLCRKLNHPQETYGWRVEYKGSVLAYTTDNEPYDPRRPDPRLLELAKGADIWITDCQYTQSIYSGTEGGVPRHGWGHSYPEAVAVTAVDAGVKKVVLFHHDPASSDAHIKEMETHTQILVSALVREGGPTPIVIAAYEGLELTA